MKNHLLFIALIVIAALFNGCIIVDDDDCWYETKCSYMCDLYGNNCVVDWCRDELVCYYD